MRRKNTIRKLRLKAIDRIVSRYIENDPTGKAGYLEDMREIQRLCLV